MPPRAEARRSHKQRCRREKDMRLDADEPCVAVCRTQRTKEAQVAIMRTTARLRRYQLRSRRTPQNSRCEPYKSRVLTVRRAA